MHRNTITLRDAPRVGSVTRRIVPLAATLAAAAWWLAPVVAK